MNLVDTSINVISYAGQDNFVLDEGVELKIETSSGGEDILKVSVPVGKSWQVNLRVIITETDTV